MLTLTLQRGTPGTLSIPGELYVNSEHECFTLENRADAIPAGMYPVTLYFSPHFQRPMPMLQGVPGRSFIEIHYGNFPSNYQGCIGVGEQRDTSTEEIFYTQEAFRELFPVIEAAIKSGSGCQIEVLDWPTTTSDLDAGDL